MYFRVTIHLRSRRLKNSSTYALCKPQHVNRTMYIRFSCLYWIILVINWACRTGTPSAPSPAASIETTGAGSSSAIVMLAYDEAPTVYSLDDDNVMSTDSLLVIEPHRRHVGHHYRNERTDVDARLHSCRDAQKVHGIRKWVLLRRW